MPRTTGIVLDVAGQRGGVMPGVVTLWDRSRFANPGVFGAGASAPTWAQEPTGLWVLRFDGADDYISVAHHASQLLTTGGTIEVWVKMVGSGAALEYFLVDKSLASFVGAGGYVLALTWGTPFFYINNGVSISGGGALPQNVWVHLAVTFDSGGNSIIYRNGAISVSGACSNPSGITTTNPLAIGNRSAATDRTFDGMVGKVFVFNSILTGAQVFQRFNQTRRWFGV